MSALLKRLYLLLATTLILLTSLAFLPGGAASAARMTGPPNRVIGECIEGTSTTAECKAANQAIRLNACQGPGSQLAANMAAAGTGTPQAFAANNEISALVPDICQWMASTYNLIGSDQLGVPKLLKEVAGAFAILLFVIGVYKTAFLQANPMATFSLVLKFVAAIFIITNLYSIQRESFNMFKLAYTTTENAMKDRTNANMNKAIAGVVAEVGTVSKLISLTTVSGQIMTLGNRIYNGSWSETLTAPVDTVVSQQNNNSLTGILKAGWLLVAPFLGVYASLLYGMALTLIVLILALPLNAAWMMFGSSKPLIANFAAILGVIFGVIFLPISFNIAVDIGYIQPMVKAAKILESHKTEITDTTNALKEALNTQETQLAALRRAGDAAMSDPRLGPIGAVEAPLRQARMAELQAQASALTSRTDKVEDNVVNDSLKSAIATATKQVVWGFVLQVFGMVCALGVMVGLPAIVIRQFVGGIGGNTGTITTGQEGAKGVQQISKNVQDFGKSAGNVVSIAAGGGRGAVAQIVKRTSKKG